MTPKEFERLYNQIRQMKPPGKLFFCGEENLLKEGLIRGVLSLVPKELLPFNSDVIWMDSNPDPRNIIDIVISPPMMADCRVVVLRNFKVSRLLEREIIDGFSSIKFPPTTILAVESDELDLKSKENRKVTEIFDVYNISSPEDKELVEWVMFFVRREKKRISVETAAKLVETAGISLGTLREEIRKLCLSVEGEDIRQEHIGEIVAKSRSAHIFQFSNAVISLDFGIATKVALELMSFGENYGVILSWMQKDILNLLWAKIDNKSLSKMLGSRGFLAAKITRSASTVRVEKLLEALDIVYEADALVKSGRANETTALVWALAKTQSLLSGR